MSTDAMAGMTSVDGTSISQIETPQSIDELRELVTRERSSTLIAGSGSRLAFGNVGGPFKRAISLRGLNRVIHYEPDDLTVAVEPGITVSELNQVLGESMQMLPIDTPGPDTATIGGTYASGLGGPRRLGYGSLRDWVLGVEVMDPDGVVTKSGGMVVKNVTGYDLPRLHYGAHGAFGIVTRINLKVFPSPAATRSIVMNFATEREAHVAGMAALASQLEPVSIIVSNAHGWQLAMRCDGAARSMEHQVLGLVEAAQHGVAAEEVLIGDEGSVAVDPFGDVARIGGPDAAARLAVPPSRQVEVLEQCVMLPEARVCADLGSGLIYVAGPPTIEWREAVCRLSERPTFLSLPAELKVGVDVFGGMDDANARLATGLKDAFDPERLLNRGRFVLGL